MKNIEQILKSNSIEVTDEQLKAIKDDLSENYKPISDYEKQLKKLSDAEEKAKAIQTQLDDAGKTIEDLESQLKNLPDVEGLNNQIAEYKARAEKAENEAQTQIVKRDQIDYLKAEFDKLDIKSERTRKSLMDDIMGEDGLKWKDGQFLGLKDYLENENKKDHFYLTEDEKKQADAEAGKAKAEPFTAPGSGNSFEPEKDTFSFGFTPIRAKTV